MRVDEAHRRLRLAAPLSLLALIAVLPAASPPSHRSSSPTSAASAARPVVEPSLKPYASRASRSRRSQPAPAGHPLLSRTQGTGRPATFGHLNWYALARCESTNNRKATSRSGKFRGLYQFSLSTWYSVGGTGDPIDASPAEQTYRAWLLYQRDGRAPWPECGRYL